jgi:hypothetical protein
VLVGEGGGRRPRGDAEFGEHTRLAGPGFAAPRHGVIGRRRLRHPRQFAG